MTLRKELSSAFHHLQRVDRFVHMYLPTTIYSDNVGTHTVDVYTRVKAFREKYPKPNDINWKQALRTAIHHDEREKFFNDRVNFDPNLRNTRRDQEIRRTVQWLKQDSRVADMIIQFENTADMLKGKKPPASTATREDILVATQDLISGADVFHLETVRERSRPEIRHYYPINASALTYAPRMLMRYKEVIPQINADAQFNKYISEDIDSMLQAIKSRWSYMPENLIPGEMKKALEDIQ